MSGGIQAWLVPSCYGVAWKSSRSVLTVGSGDIDGGGFEQGQWRSRRVERKRERGEVNAKTSYRVTGREEAATRQTSFIGYFLRDGQVERYSASKTPTVCFRSLQCERHGGGFFLLLEKGRGRKKRDHGLLGSRKVEPSLLFIFFISYFASVFILLLRKPGTDIIQSFLIFVYLIHPVYPFQ